MKIIGLNGYAKSGKDAAAKFLINMGWQRLAFADVLRDIAYATDPYVMHAGDFVRLSQVVDEIGWDKAKQGQDVRRLLQRLGTEGGRDILGENIWVDTAFSRIRPDTPGVVFTDVRFQNEADRIHQSRGVIVRMTRPGIGPVNGHVSDKMLGDVTYDIKIVNDGTLAKLGNAIRAVAHAVR